MLVPRSLRQVIYIVVALVLMAPVLALALFRMDRLSSGLVSLADRIGKWACQ